MSKQKEVQFLLTINVKDIDKFENDLKVIKHKILIETKNSLLLNNNDGSVEIERVK